MKFCTKILTSDGDIKNIDDDEKDRILNEEIIDQFAKKGLRTFVYAYKDIDSDFWEELQAGNNNFVKEEDRLIVENDLIFVAGFGIIDELREGVSTSIKNLKLSGVNTRMISGDNVETAVACAKKAGILLEGEEKKPLAVMTGAQFTEEIQGIRKV